MDILPCLRQQEPNQNQERYRAKEFPAILSEVQAGNIG